MLLKYVLSPTVIYMEDVEAAGGGVLLEEIKATYKGMRVFAGTLYLCGKHWNVELIHYKKGKGRIIKITEPKEREAEALVEIKNLLSKKMMDGNTLLFQIRSRRKINRMQGRVLSILSIISIYDAFYAFFEYNNIISLYIAIASVLILALSIHVTNTIKRG